VTPNRPKPPLAPCRLMACRGMCWPLALTSAFGGEANMSLGLGMSANDPQAKSPGSPGGKCILAGNYFTHSLSGTACRSGQSIVPV
jgi:hypothetical protein